jgi:hypothetical protein
MSKQIIPIELIQQKIYLIRGEKVMFDRDLAMLYGVETKVLNRAVKRNIKRFPSDFMFRLNKQETEIFSRCQIGTLKDDNLRYQIGTSSYGGRRYLPYVFTEQGVAMLSSVLNSERAIQVNIQIMRIFTSLRKMLLTHKELKEKIEKMEKKYDKQFRIVFETIKLLLKEDEKPKEPIGFRCD